MRKGIHNDVSCMLKLLDQLTIAEVLSANICLTTAYLAIR